MQVEGKSQRVSVTVIGRSHASEFRGLVRQIQNSTDIQITGLFDTIEEALHAGLADHLPADIVVVLQAFSDEYSAADAGQLIGRMLFRRVLCCYGPWCLSDGRTHEIWPVVARVSVASAWNVIKQEVCNIGANRAALLPMAAAEEVFAHRAIVESEDYPTSYDAILIVSDDRTLRETIAELLRHAANQVFNCSTSVPQIQHSLEMLNKADVVHSRVSVMLDIDGQEVRERELVEMIRLRFPKSDLIRLTSFPQAVTENSSFRLVIDKLEAATLLRA